MRQLVITEYVSLDGVIEDPGGAEKTRHGGWTVPYWSDDIAKVKFDELFASDALLLGRVTYQGFAAAWPSMKDEAGFSDRMNGNAKYVVSSTLQKPEWNNSRVINGNIAEEVAKLKQLPGQDILVAGSSKLVPLLLQNGLVDELRLLVYPVVLGSGKRLYNSPDKLPLKLAESKTLDKGVILLRYLPEGKSKSTP